MKSLKVICLIVLMIESLSAYEDRDEPTAEENRAEVLQKFDTNEDERISLKEAFGGLKDNFEKHDLDANGFIETIELDTLPNHPPHDQESDLEGTDFHKHTLQRHDQDRDGKISLEEAHGGMKKNFNRHDLNSDGYIAGDELNTLPKHKRGRHDKHPNDRR